MIQETSILAYHEAIKKLGEKQRMVFDVIEKNPGLANIEIASKLHWPINRVTPRVKELRELGLVGEYGFVNVNGRKSIAWQVIRDFAKPKQKELFSEINVY